MSQTSGLLGLGSVLSGHAQELGTGPPPSLAGQAWEKPPRSLAPWLGRPLRLFPDEGPLVPLSGTLPVSIGPERQTPAQKTWQWWGRGSPVPESR